MEIVVWIAFLVIYSIFQALSGKKKKQRKKTPIPGQQEKRPATLQEALREIQEALQQARQPEPKPAPPPSPAPPSRPSPSTKPAPTRREPEFHTMESTIKNKSLESETQFSSTFTQRVLEKKTTYEDSFPTTTFSDDRFAHAHPERTDAGATTPKRENNKRLRELQTNLTDQKSIRDAFVLSEILGKPKSLR